MVWAVVIQVVVEFVCNGGELFEEVVGVLFAAGLSGVGVQGSDGVAAGVEEFDEDQDAVVGDIGGGAQLLDLGFREGGIVSLSGVYRGGDGQQEEREQKATNHADLVNEDLGEELVVDLVEPLEGGLEGGTVFSGCLVEILAEFVGGVVHQLLGVLEALGIVGEVEVNELCVAFDLLEGGAGLVDVSLDHLFTGDLSHGVDEFGIEEALVARARLFGAKFKLVEGQCVGQVFINGCRVDWSAQGEEYR